MGTEDRLHGGVAPVGVPWRRLAAVAAFAVLLGVVVVAAGVAGPWDPPLSEPRSLLPTPKFPPVPEPPGPAAARTVPRLGPDVDLGFLLWIGLALAAYLVVWAAVRLFPLLRRWLPRWPVRVTPDDAGTDQGHLLAEAAEARVRILRGAVEEAGEAIRRHERPADAVIAAWVALEKAAERSGIRRDPASTPTEFTVSVLDRTPVEPAATRALLELYLRARFSGDAMTSADVTAATEALTTLSTGLSGSSR